MWTGTYQTGDGCWTGQWGFMASHALTVLGNDYHNRFAALLALYKFATDKMGGKMVRR